MEVDKTFLQNLLDEESDRVAFSTNKGKSDVWQHFVIVLHTSSARVVFTSAKVH